MTEHICDNFNLVEEYYFLVDKPQIVLNRKLNQIKIDMYQNNYYILQKNILRKQNNLKYS